VRSVYMNRYTYSVEQPNALIIISEVASCTLKVVSSDFTVCIGRREFCEEPSGAYKRFNRRMKTRVTGIDTGDKEMYKFVV
jgi:hypothetical protein